jgi:hypothetical protein
MVEKIIWGWMTPLLWHILGQVALLLVARGYLQTGQLPGRVGASAA